MVREMVEAKMRKVKVQTVDVSDLSMEDTEGEDMAVEDITTKREEIDNPTNRTRVIQRERTKAVRPRV